VGDGYDGWSEDSSNYEIVELVIRCQKRSSKVSNWDEDRAL
jgi:hypothetical protein